jgi:hypothetical protein
LTSSDLGESPFGHKSVTSNDVDSNPVRGTWFADEVQARVAEKFHERHKNPKPLCHDQVVAAVTGRMMDPLRWVERGQADAKLSEQTAVLADLLEVQGVRTRLDDDVAFIGLITGRVDRSESYRPICFLPLVAQRERRPVLNSLRYFHGNDRNGKYLRMMVVTAGQRVPLNGDLRETIQGLSRQISRWAHEARDRFGIEILFRGTEFTIDDEQTFHVHANVLYAPMHKLSKRRFRKFMRWTHGRLGRKHMRDCGLLEKPEEAIKYPFKPADLDNLLTDPKAIVWLYEQTRRLKMVQPMGRFAEFQLDLKSTRQKIVSFPTARGPRLFRVRKKSRGGPLGKKSVVIKDGDPAENRIVAETLPQHRHTPFAEPCLLVQNFTSTPSTDFGADALIEIQGRRRDHLDYWKWNGAPDPETALAYADGLRATRPGSAQNVLPFNVHTGRSTVHRPHNEKLPNAPPSDPPIPINGPADLLISENQHPEPEKISISR